VQLRSFLDAEAKRPAGNGIRPIGRMAMKIVMPRRELLYARLCPFCRKARGEIQSIGGRQFHGVCPKCGATGLKQESQQEMYSRKACPLINPFDAGAVNVVRLTPSFVAV
jgi:hypothetical protein